MPEDRGLHVMQANLNHCGAAQELWFHSLARLGIGLAVVTEPYRVRQETELSSTCGLVAMVRREEHGSPPLTLLESGEGFVAGSWGDVIVIGCYCPPHQHGGLVALEGLLGRVSDFLSRARSGSLLVLGDFNSWSREWGSRRTNARGRKLGDWARGEGLLLVNRGSAPTCVRSRGESIVDLTFASAGIARRVSKWQVRGEETGSDHLYISMVLSPPLGATRRILQDGEGPPRWALRSLDPGGLLAALCAVAWGDTPGDPCGDPEEEAE